LLPVRFQVYAKITTPPAHPPPHPIPPLAAFAPDVALELMTVLTESTVRSPKISNITHPPPVPHAELQPENPPPPVPQALPGDIQRNLLLIKDDGVFG
jgi:hypothetical protein